MQPESPSPDQGQIAVFYQRHRTGLVTLVFTDLVDSTALMRQLGDQAGTTFLQQRRQIVRQTLKEFLDGEEIETAGDSFLLIFAKPSDAVRFALLVQARFRAFRHEKQIGLLERIGIHLGEVVIKEHETEAKAKDLYGIQIGACARVMSLAQGGQVLMTRGVFDSARQVLKGEDIPGVGRLSWVSHGPYVLKGIEEAVEVCEVGEAGQSPLVAPKTTEKAERYVTAESEPVLGWRPAIGQEVPPVPAVGRVMLAVLPFENLSGDREQEYFSDGLTWEMIAELGSLGSHRLGVIAQKSAMKYKDTDKGIDQIGRELGVDYILEGSVRRGTERLRITAQLIVVRDQTRLWGGSYDRKLSNILAVQSEIAQAVAAGIQIAIAPEAQARLARARPVNPEAHQACLLGRWHFDKYSFKGFPKARECFELAIAKDPNYAPAYAWLAMAYGGAAYWGYMAPSETYPKLQAALMRAAELDGTLAEVHMGLAGCSYFFDWDWPAAERSFKQALALNPNLSEARHSYSFLLATMGRLDEAIVEARRAVELDPLNLVGLAVRGAHAFDARRWDEAIAQFQVPLEMDATFFPARQGLWRAYRHKNLYEKAFIEARQAFLLQQDDEVAKAMNQGWQESGYRGAMRLAAETLAARSKQTYVRPTTIALLCAEAENKDQALYWLDKAYEECDSWLVHLRSPDWDSLRSDPGFQDLLKRMKYPPL